jgi:hypothetical protein
VRLGWPFGGRSSRGDVSGKRACALAVACGAAVLWAMQGAGGVAWSLGYRTLIFLLARLAMDGRDLQGRAGEVGSSGHTETAECEVPGGICLFVADGP